MINLGIIFEIQKDIPNQLVCSFILPFLHSMIIYGALLPDQVWGYSNDKDEEARGKCKVAI